MDYKKLFDTINNLFNVPVYCSHCYTELKYTIFEQEILIEPCQDCIGYAVENKLGLSRE